MSTFNTIYPETMESYIAGLPVQDHHSELRRLPTAVPLPDANNYTDQIVFDDLCLPVGFKHDKMSVNLRAIQRVQRIAGLGPVNFFDYLLSETGYPRHNNLTDTVVTYDNTGEGKTGYGRPRVAVAINRGESNERIAGENKHDIDALYSPKSQAIILDKAIRNGLVEASLRANIDSSKLAWLAGFLIGGSIALNTIPDAGATPQALVGTSLVTNEVMNLIRHTVSRRREGNTFWGDLKTLRRSLIVGLAADRVAVASLYAASTRFARHTNNTDGLAI